MKKRWSISSDGGTTWPRIVAPVNGSKIKINDKRELDKGQIFFRRELSTSISIGNAEGDFDYLFGLERRGTQRCETLQIRVQILCNQAWQTFWTGQFSPGSCKWDLDNCVVDIKPETVDRYTCLLSKEKVKRNILQAGTVDASALLLPSLEFGVCWSIGVGFPANCIQFYNGVSFVDEWQPGHAQVEDANGDSYQLNIFWRENVTTECVAGSPAPPVGLGWVLDVDNCAVNGTATYIRQTAASWDFGDAVEGTIVDGVPTPPDSDCQYQYVGTINEADIDPFDPTLGEVPYFICLNAAEGTEINRARLVKEATEYLIEQSGCELEGVRSDFFEWDPVGDAPGYVAGQNYITGSDNQVDHLLILQNTDVIDPSASNPATIGEMTFAEMMQALFVMFRVFWDIDDQGYVRIEHWHYWTFSQGLDLTATTKTIEPQLFEHLNEEIPKVERMTFMESQGRDFVGKDIIYSAPCATGEEVKEWSPGKITTDVSFILSDPDAISRDGFVIIASSFDGSEYSALLDVGAITGNFTTNAPLSAANLQRDYWTWDRYLSEGNMNGEDTTFDGFLPNIEQPNVRLTLCCELLTFDPKDTIKTRLKSRLGTGNAIVEDVEYDLPVDRTRFTLRYSY